eukprot:g339.t1
MLGGEEDAVSWDGPRVVRFFREDLALGDRYDEAITKQLPNGQRLAFYVTGIYLCNRVIISRCVPYTKLPVFLLPIMFAQDFFCELIFIDFNPNGATFWLVMLLDTCLLVMRDAELWDDLAKWVWKHTGTIGGTLFGVLEVMIGNSDGMTERTLFSNQARRFSTAAAKANDAMSEPDFSTVRMIKREITETAVLTELLSTVLLLTVVSYEIILDTYNVPGKHTFTNYPDDAFASLCEFSTFDGTCKQCECSRKEAQQKRLNTVIVYLVTMVFQILGLCLSHRIVQYKNQVEERLQKMAALAQSTSLVKLRGRLKYHFFLSHAQATGQDQVSALCQMLQSLGFICWYDMEAEDLTLNGMSDGVAQSEIYVLFLSEGALGRPMVQHELRDALRLNKTIITLFETDERHGKFDFAAGRRECPEDLRGPVLDDIEGIPYRRRKHERHAMLTVFAERAGAAYKRQVQEVLAQSQKSKRRSSVMGSWFDATLVKSTQERWRETFFARSLILVFITGMCLFFSTQIRATVGVATESDFIDIDFFGTKNAKNAESTNSADCTAWKSRC